MTTGQVESLVFFGVLAAGFLIVAIKIHYDDKHRNNKR